jgi:acyl carrier protein
MNRIEKQVRNFIVENFLFGDAENVEDDTSLLEMGILDSTGILELVTFLKDELGINVEDEELIPDNFDSLNRIYAFLKKKTTLAA